MELTISPVNKRFLALLIDSVIIYLAGSLLSSIFYYGTFSFMFFDKFDLNWSMFKYSGMMFVIVLAYYTFCESSMNGATVGKRLMGIRVVDADGYTLTARTALLRNISKLLLGQFFVLGFFFAFLNQKNQALHDLIAGSVVVDGFEQ